MANPNLARPDGAPSALGDIYYLLVDSSWPRLTMGTIGYGRLAPGTAWSNVLVTVEVITGVLGLAMVTGLAFAKFSRVTVRVVFSRVAVVARHDETVSQTIHARHTYAASEIVWGARLRDVLRQLPDGRRQVDYARFHDTEPAAER